VLGLALRAPKLSPWAGVYFLIVAAWIALYLLSLEHVAGPTYGALDTRFDAQLWQRLCRAAPSYQTLPSVYAMWALMCVAMMLPSALAFLSQYRELSLHAAAKSTSLAFVTTGYLLAWLAISTLAALGQVMLVERGQLTPNGIMTEHAVAAALLIVAGLYQFTPTKQSALRQCQHPMQFIFSHWRGGHWGGFKLGFHHGLVCIKCCWALMLLAFVAGTMNLAWMGIATALMTLEKLRATGTALSYTVGVTLIAAGGMAIALAR
jgi:predicted metal-binding membrane protein